MHWRHADIMAAGCEESCDLIPTTPVESVRRNSKPGWSDLLAAIAVTAGAMGVAGGASGGTDAEMCRIALAAVRH